MSKLNRLIELDVFRGIAAIGVVFFHYTTRYNSLYGHSSEVRIDFPYGPYGIDLFFMISGFVIFMSLEKTQRSLDFVVARFSRLYPAYWTAVILTFTIVAVAKLPGREVNWREALINLTMCQSFLEVHLVDGVYWTLALELSFYILIFFIYKFQQLKHIDTISIAWLLLMVMNIALKKQHALVLNFRVELFFMLAYAHLFILGMMFYKIYSEGFSVKRYAIILACLVVHKLGNNWQSTLIVCLFVMLFYLMLKGRLAFINCKPLLFLGTISYTLYLIHQNIGYVIIRAGYKIGINPNASIFMAIASAIFLASIITFQVEQPMMRLLKKQYKTRILKQT